MNTIGEANHQQIEARKATYRLLGRLWIREVDAALWHALSDGPLAAALQDAGGVLPSGNDEVDLLELLSTDYCQLLIGPQHHVPPYQSVQEQGRLAGRAVDSMKQYASAMSYAQRKPDDSAMWDHLGVQLDAMAFALQRMTDERDRGMSRHRRAEWEVFLAGFFVDHLAWSLSLLRQLEQNAQTDFYRTTAILTREFLESEQNEFNQCEIKRSPA